jgi:hypothetical protein
VWLLYGLSIESLPLILVDGAGLACGLVTLAITLKMRGSLVRPSSWRQCREPPGSMARTVSQLLRLAEHASHRRAQRRKTTTLPLSPDTKRGGADASRSQGARSESQPTRRPE